MPWRKANFFQLFPGLSTSRYLCPVYSNVVHICESPRDHAGSQCFELSQDMGTMLQLNIHIYCCTLRLILFKCVRVCMQKGKEKWRDWSFPSLQTSLSCCLLCPSILELVTLSSFLFAVIEMNRHSQVSFVLLLTFSHTFSLLGKWTVQ